jgi:hypothetical protein
MYYSLNTDGAENIYMRKAAGLNGHISLAIGQMLDIEKDRINLPYQFTMSVVADQEPRYYGWYPGSHLMQTRFVDTLKNAGVDNLQLFPAQIRHKTTNQEVPGYSVVNIVGRVSCANLKESDAEKFIGDAHFIRKLVIDPAQTRGLLMFRLHESPMIVLVHETVAKAIESGNFTGLTLEPVGEAPKT